jgi:purine-binding chemotaxis protein CheW
VQQAPTASTRICLFELNKQMFAVEGRYSRQFVRVEHLTRVPHAPEALLGLFSARGQVRALIDLGSLIGLASDEPSPLETAALFEINGSVVALAVDRMVGFPAYNPENARSLRRSSDAVLEPFSKGVISIEDGEAVMLDLERIIEHLNATINPGIAQPT